jgi:hypothetical protein
MSIDRYRAICTLFIVILRLDYDEFLRSLMVNIKDVQEAFNARAKRRELINSEAAAVLLDDVSVITSFDLEDAKYWFSPQNKSITKKYNLK